MSKGDAWTQSNGSVNELNCSTCAPGLCSEHGLCALTADFRSSCKCNTGYSGSLCDQFWLLDAILGGVGVVVVVLLAMAIYSAVKRRFKSYRIQSELKQHLLDEASMELRGK